MVLVDANEKLYAGVETITPGYATALIERDKLYREEHGLHQRAVARSGVRMYGKDMAEGRWVVNGESVILINDYLANGNHRLHACINSDVPFTTLVLQFRGIPPEEAHRKFLPMDNGIIRNAAHVFELGDAVPRKEASAVAATVRIVQNYYNTGETSRLMGKSENSRNARLEFFNQHPEIAESVRACSTVPIRPLRVVAALHHIIGVKFGSSVRDIFFDRLASGANLQPDQPSRVLRDALFGLQPRKGGEGKARVVAAMMIKGFNAEYTGATASGAYTVRYRPNHDGYPKFTEEESPNSRWF